MNIAIISTGSDYDDPVGDQILHSPYILILNHETFQYDVLRNPLALESEMQNNFNFILLMIRNKISSVLVKKCEPDLKMLLTIHGIHVVESTAGEVGEVVDRIRSISLGDTHIIPVNEIISENEPQSTLQDQHLKKFNHAV